MNIATVPPEFQTPRLRPEPDTAFGFNIEEYFHQWLIARQPETKTSRVYLPIYWWNNAAAGYLSRNGDEFRAIPAVQEFLDGLNRCQWFFTVSRGADGIYEDVPPNVVVFSAGGKGTFPIPHLLETGPAARHTKELLASFMGNIECCGPDEPPPVGKSSWNRDGAGARVRRKMASVFQNEPDCSIVNQMVDRWDVPNPPEHREFIEIAESSWFGLAPRGYGRTSYRLYEMLHLGAIPVYVYDDPWLPYLDRLDWTEFCVLCHESELDGLPQRLRAIPISERESMLSRGQSLIQDWFTIDGLCLQILYYVGLL